MAAASQLARRAGPAIYITLAFHRSPLTRRCLGPEARWPQGSSSHPGTETACEGLARPGEPYDWGREGQQPPLSTGPEASGRKEEATGAGSLPGERPD